MSGNEIKIRIVKCLDAAKSNKPTALERKRIIKRSKDRNYFCFLCGQEMDFSSHSTESNAFSIDHIWPRQIGGWSSNENYSAACQECNNKIKTDFIDYADYHYEKISFSTSPYAFLPKDRKSRIELAVFSKTNYCCIVCSQPAFRIGELYVGKLEPGDGWHYFNLAPYCKKHRPKEENYG